MNIIDTPLSGAFRIEVDALSDERGLFARTYCRETFAKAGLNPDIAQCNTSFNPHRHTLRGMHFQAAPYEEDKVVRCTAGEIFDVAIDLRPGSPTFRQWHGVTLTAQNRTMFYIPKGFAHGFLTLTSNAEVLYLMSTPYQSGVGSGVRWNDPAFGIDWPAEPRMMSPRDAEYPGFTG